MNMLFYSHLESRVSGGKRSISEDLSALEHPILNI